MRIQSWCKTDRGLRREVNQDSFLINEDLGLYVVADGMGGHKGGEIASSLAVKTAEEFLAHPPIPGLQPRDLMMGCFSEASRRIHEIAIRKESNLAGMGTTMVALHLVRDRFYIGNVGDSRAYLFRRPFLWQITEDHSLMMDQLRSGLIQESQLSTYMGRNVITRSVGYEREVAADLFERQLIKGDVFLLCSDGLSSLVEDDKIAALLNRHRAEEFVDVCVSEALNNGGDDNVTVLVVEIS